MLLKREVNDLVFLLQKVKKVYESCETRGQWLTAFRFSRQVLKKHDYMVVWNIISDIEMENLKRIIESEE